MAHGWRRAWIRDPAQADGSASAFVELTNFDHLTHGADLRNFDTVDIFVKLKATDTATAALLVKGALLRITDRNTSTGKAATSGSDFFRQDYIIREPEFDKLRNANIGVWLRGFQDGYDLADTILTGTYQTGTVLAQAASSGATSIVVVTQAFRNGDVIRIGALGTGTAEVKTITTVVGTTINFGTGLANNHAQGEAVIYSTAKDVFDRLVDDANGTPGVPTLGSTTVPATTVSKGTRDTTGAAATIIQYQYSNDKAMQKVKDLGGDVGCIVQVRRAAATPSTSSIDFLNANSTIAVRPVGNLLPSTSAIGFQTADPIVGGYTGWILNTFGSLRDYVQNDEVEAQSSNVAALGGGTGSTQATGLATGSGRGAVYNSTGLVPGDNSSALAVATARQQASPSPRVYFDIANPQLWTGAFKGILGDTIAVKDASGRLTGNFVGQFVRWQYSQDRNVLRIWLNRTRYYDDDVTKTIQRNFEQATRSNQGAQNVTSPVFSQDSSSAAAVNVKFYVPDNVDKVQQLVLNIRAAQVRKNSNFSNTAFGAFTVVWPNGPSGTVPTVVDLNNGDSAIITTGALTVSSNDIVDVQLSITPYNDASTATTIPTLGFHPGHNLDVGMAVKVNAGSFVTQFREAVTAWPGAYTKVVQVPLTTGGATTVNGQAVLTNKEPGLTYYRVDMFVITSNQNTGISMSGATSATVALAIDGVGVSGGGAVVVNDATSFTIPIGTGAGQFPEISKGFHTLTITPTSATAVNLTGQLDIHVAYRK